MNAALALVAGVALGFVAAKLLIEPSSCCRRVAGAVRERVDTELGSEAAAVGDLLGAWDFAPGLLDFFGVE